jgi:hypothetical protein
MLSHQRPKICAILCRDIPPSTEHDPAQRPPRGRRLYWPYSSTRSLPYLNIKSCPSLGRSSYQPLFPSPPSPTLKPLPPCSRGVDLHAPQSLQLRRLQMSSAPYNAIAHGHRFGCTILMNWLDLKVRLPFPWIFCFILIQSSFSVLYRHPLT